MRGHADAETLAAFREDLLSRRKAARVSAHLAACPRCAGLDAQLTEVTALLTRAAAPPMPDALTTRIEAAIAAEAAARAATAADGAIAAGAAGATARGREGAAGPSGQRADRAARPPARPRRSILVLRVAAVTAAVVVVAGGGYGVAALLSGSPSKGTAASAGAPGARPKVAPGMSAGSFRAAAPGGKAATGTSAPAARIVSSGTNYQPGQLKSQVSAALTTLGRRTAQGSGAGPGPNTPPAGTILRMPACVAHVTGGTRPLLVDLARYQGRPATIIVLPSDHPATLRILVIAAGCSTTTAHVLATTTIPAPG